MIRKYKDRFLIECLYNSLTQDENFRDSVALLASNADAKLIMPEVYTDITIGDLHNAHQHILTAHGCGYDVESYDSYIVEHYLLRVGSEYAEKYGL